MDYRKKLIVGAQKLGVELTKKQEEQFIKYMNILQDWNRKINLTSLDTPDEIIVKHFLDSMSCIKGMEINGDEKIIDVGTGAGFPAIPLKIMYPDLKLTLLDSLQKRINFLQQLCYKLDLKEVEFIHGRAEDYGQNNKYREKYDYVLARAVASLNLLSEYTIPFVTIGGSFIAQKGSEVKKEVINGQEAINILGGEIYDIKEVNLPYTSAERYLVIIDKLSATPIDYPRKAGTPSKKPL